MHLKKTKKFLLAFVLCACAAIGTLTLTMAAPEPQLSFTSKAELQKYLIQQIMTYKKQTLPVIRLDYPEGGSWDVAWGDGLASADDDISVPADLALSLNALRGHHFDNYTVQYTVNPLVSEKQQAVYNKVMKKTLKKLKLKGKSDKVKARKIARYIENTVSYDHKEAVLSHTAYNPLIKHKAVCEGYSALMYDMCRRSGIPCRIISGNGTMKQDKNGFLYEESHAWNIVKINGKWYDCDVTWSDQGESGGSVRYEFAGSKAFSKDHHPEGYYASDEFVASHPISKTKLK
jgi:hypothetical protein